LLSINKLKCKNSIFSNIEINEILVFYYVANVNNIN
jgi:hypothetical protein